MRLAHLLAAVAINHVDHRRIQPPGRQHYMLEQGAPRKTMQYLGQAGLHPLALACGEDDDVQRSHGESRWISLRKRDVMLA